MGRLHCHDGDGRAVFDHDVGTRAISACDRYAHDYARRRTRGNIAGSAARSALVGAGVGSLVDGRQGARRGANLGLGAALMSGTITAYGEYERHFNSAFRRCMRI